MVGLLRFVLRPRGHWILFTDGCIMMSQPGRREPDKGSISRQIIPTFCGPAIRARLRTLSRIRLLLADEAMGVSLDAFAESVRRGVSALAFIDELTPSPARHLPETYWQVAARVSSGTSGVR